jgi:hypothetical protein
MDRQGDSYIPPQTLFAGGIIISLPATDKYYNYHCTFNWKYLTRGNYNICLFLGEILLFLFMITGNVSHRGNYNICLFLGDILLFLFMITGNVSHSGNYNICLLLGEILLYPLQTKFGGVYRNHPVIKKITISLPEADKYYNYHGVRHFQLS